MTQDPPYNRYAGFVSLPGADGKMPRPLRVDEDGNVIYLDEERDAVRPAIEAGADDLAKAGIMNWDQLAWKLDEQRSRLPTRVTVDESCADIPAAYDPLVHNTALETLRRSVNDKAAGTAENGFFASEKIFDDGYSVGPIFKSGFQHRINGAQIERRKPGVVRSLLNRTYRPSLFVHAHPNHVPAPLSDADRKASDEIQTPVAAIDRSGKLYCVLPKRK